MVLHRFLNQAILLATFATFAAPRCLLCCGIWEKDCVKSRGSSSLSFLVVRCVRQHFPWGWQTQLPLMGYCRQQGPSRACLWLLGRAVKRLFFGITKKNRLYPLCKANCARMQQITTAINDRWQRASTGRPVRREPPCLLKYSILIVARKAPYLAHEICFASVHCAGMQNKQCTASNHM